MKKEKLQNVTLAVEVWSVVSLKRDIVDTLKKMVNEARDKEK